jgi:hypothetical protein
VKFDIFCIIQLPRICSFPAFPNYCVFYNIVVFVFKNVCELMCVFMVNKCYFYSYYFAKMFYNTIVTYLMSLNRDKKNLEQPF